VITSSDLRHYDQLDVVCKVRDSGLTKIYTGFLYFIGSETAVMIGRDEIRVDCIEWIQPKENNR